MFVLFCTIIVFENIFIFILFILFLFVLVIVLCEFVHYIAYFTYLLSYTFANTQLTLL